MCFLTKADCSFIILSNVPIKILQKLVNQNLAYSFSFLRGGVAGGEIWKSGASFVFCHLALYVKNVKEMNYMFLTLALLPSVNVHVCWKNMLFRYSFL